MDINLSDPMFRLRYHINFCVYIWTSFTNLLSCFTIMYITNPSSDGDSNKKRRGVRVLFHKENNTVILNNVYKSRRLFTPTVFTHRPSFVFLWLETECGDVFFMNFIGIWIYISDFTKFFFLGVFFCILFLLLLEALDLYPFLKNLSYVLLCLVFFYEI